MTVSTWDPNNADGWKLSNSNLTATSPDNNTQGPIYTAFSGASVQDHAKTYFEFDNVSGAAVQTAFTLGVGVHGFNPSAVNLKAEGQIIPNASFVGFSYNLGIANSGNVIYDPQDNADYAKLHPGAIAAPNQWPNGSTVGVLVDRVDNTIQFTLNGQAEGGPFDISGLAGKTIFPFAYSWYKSGPVATINGGSAGFKEPLPAGYTALDGTTGSSGTPTPTPTPSSSDVITVTKPATLPVGNDVITGHETDPTQKVSLDWRTSGVPAAGASDAVAATVSSNGNFTATVPIDHAGVQSGLYAAAGSGPFKLQFLATPTAAGSSTGGSSPPPVAAGNTVTVNQPSPLVAGVQAITGHETDPTQSVFLDWRTYGTPTAGLPEFIKATVDSKGNFTASVNVDNPGVQSGMYVYSSDTSVVKAWAATPLAH